MALSYCLPILNYGDDDEAQNDGEGGHLNGRRQPALQENSSPCLLVYVATLSTCYMQLDVFNITSMHCDRQTICRFTLYVQRGWFLFGSSSNTKKIELCRSYHSLAFSF